MRIFRQFTRKTLMRNRTRTIVTLIGIVLSMALFTAVIEGAYSGVSFMQEAEIKRSGAFHGVFSGLNAEGVAALEASDGVQKCAVWQEVGWAEIGSKNDTKPYLLIESMGEGFSDLVSVRLSSGRMPENDGEILLPEHLSSNGGVALRVGKTLTLSVGRRMTSDGYPLNERNPFYEDDEVLTECETRTYTVIGTYARPDGSVEHYSCPGYTALTVGGGSGDYAAFFTVEHPMRFYSITETWKVPGTLTPNTDLLRLCGAEANDSIRTVIYRFAALLVFLVSLGSISLIYNSFSISVGERTRQFGILKSVGATKKQIRSCVLYEALLLAGIGVPLGLLVGCTGIGITFYCLQDAFLAMIPDGIDVSIRMVPNVTALVISALVCVATTLISAWIPARRAMCVPPMEAIRQTDDVKITRRDVRPYRLTRKLFGFEGMMAAKNFRRNRRRYRATVISLFLSITLFITSSSFCSYLTESVEGYTSGSAQCDITYIPRFEKDENEIEELSALFASIGGITESAFVNQTMLTLHSDAESAARTALAKASGESTGGGAESDEPFYAYVLFADDDTFRRLCRENGVDPAPAFSSDAPQGILYNREITRVQDGNSYKLVASSPVDKASLPVTLYAADDEGRTYGFPICAAIENTLFCLPASTAAVIYPYSMQNDVLPAGEDDAGGSALLDDFTPEFSFRVNGHKRVYEEMRTALLSSGRSTDSLYDAADSRETQVMIVNVLSVFTYGFIILISLITVANIFNTISTNVLLRRREFAMMKSVGLSDRGFGRMMCYECVIYALRSLLWGLPVSVLATYGIYRIVIGAYETAFVLPWRGIAIAVGSVFAVMIVTMLYACGKIRRDNPIDALKNENI